jgi:hypothetical protein
MTTRTLALALLLAVTPGCTLFRPAPNQRLAEADASAARGEYQVALTAYDTYLKDNPDDARIRAMRAMMADLVAARAELAALREQVAGLRAQLTRARDDASELAKVRQELTARQAEVARLREDLEALKRTDLQMERRKR